MISHKHKCIFVHIPKNAGSSVEKAFGFSEIYHQGTARHSMPYSMRGWWGKSEPNREYPFKKLYERPHHDPSYAVNFDRFFKFAIVRNPWDRFVSTYKYDKKLLNASDVDVVANAASKSSGKWLLTRRQFLAELFGGSEFSFNEFINVLADDWFGVNRDLERKEKKYFTNNPKYSWIKGHQFNQVSYIMDESGTFCLDMLLRFENLSNDWAKLCEKQGWDLELPHTNKSSGKHYTEYYDDATRDMVARRYAADIEYFGYSFGE